MFNYCKDLIRKLDYEGYLVANLACKGLQKGKLDAMMAVKAFDAEIATISHSVKTPEAAAIRYEFWGTALKRIKQKQSVDGHPVLEDLFRANLSLMQLHWLEGSLKARAESLDRRTFSLADLDEYAQKSLVPIFWCIQGILSPESSDNLIQSEHALEHLGKAQVVIRRLKGLAKALSLKNPAAEQFIPTGLLGSAGLNGPKMLESLQTGDFEKLKDVVHEMASHAHSHLQLISHHDKGNLFLKLSKYNAQRYLAELETRNFFILNPNVQRIGSQRDGLLPLKLFFQSLKS